MSQTEPQFLETDDVHALPIDEVGELARFSVSGGPGFARKSLVEIYIDGDEAASYHVEVGADRADGEGIHWFEPTGNAYTFTDITSDDQSWEQACKRLRIMIDSAASAGSEAHLLVAYGRGN